MLGVTVICVGKLKEKFYIQAVEEYAKRLSGYCRLNIVELPEERLPDSPSEAQIAAALAKEGERIWEKVPKGAVTVAMCVEGQMLSSEQLAVKMNRWAQQGPNLVFLIGGSYGLSPAVKARAGIRLSMSPMTFPHHLARVMVLEQIYRGFKINEGSRYHK